MFFDGKDNTIDHSKSLEKIKERIAKIVQANPWLVGQIVKDKKRHKNLALLAVPEPVTEKDIEAIICSINPSLSDVSTTTSNPKLNTAVAKSDAMVKVRLSKKIDRVGW